MAKSTAKNNQLTPTQEGIVAGIVLLFFGLLYWYLNPWKSDNTAQQLVTSQQTTMDSSSKNSTAATVAAPPYPTESAPAALESAKSTVPAEPTKAATSTQQGLTTVETVNTTANLAATKPTELATAQTPSTNTPITAAEPVKPTEATANNPAPSAASATTQPIHTEQTTATSSTSETAKPLEATANTEAAQPATTEQTTGVATNPEPTQTVQAATHSETSSSTTQAMSPTSTEQKPVASAIPSKLILAPGSPEAKLQGYLENNTLEKPVTMADIQFEAKQTQLTKNSEAQTLMLAALLGQYPQANFLITAYTTETGTDQTSDQLSLMRANALGMELVKAGVDGKRITIMGMGNKPPVDKSSAAQKKNQRIEISVIK